MSDALVWEYGLKHATGKIKWYPDKNEQQVLSYDKAHVFDVPHRGIYRERAKLVKRLVSTIIVDVDVT